jgi:hypothetical protein
MNVRVTRVHGDRRMKKHSAANRLNVGARAMVACYTRPEDIALSETPALALPTAPGSVDRSLSRAYGVHVTGRAPIEVKGKGLMDMYWVDPAPPQPSAAAAGASDSRSSSALGGAPAGEPRVRLPAGGVLAPISTTAEGAAALPPRHDVLLEHLSATQLSAASDAESQEPGAKRCESTDTHDQAALGRRESTGSFRVRTTEWKILQTPTTASAGRVTLAGVVGNRLARRSVVAANADWATRQLSRQLTGDPHGPLSRQVTGDPHGAMIRQLSGDPAAQLLSAQLTMTPVPEARSSIGTASVRRIAAWAGTEIERMVRTDTYVHAEPHAVLDHIPSGDLTVRACTPPRCCRPVGGVLGANSQNRRCSPSSCPSVRLGPSSSAAPPSSRGTCAPCRRFRTSAKCCAVLRPNLCGFAPPGPADSSIRRRSRTSCSRSPP